MNNKENKPLEADEQEPIQELVQELAQESTEAGGVKVDPKEIERSRQVVLDYIGGKTQEHENMKTHPVIRQGTLSDDRAKHENKEALKQESGLQKNEEKKREILKPDLKRFKTFFTLFASRTRTIPPLARSGTGHANLHFTPSRLVKKIKPRQPILSTKEEKIIFLKNLRDDIEISLEQRLRQARSSLAINKKEPDISAPLKLDYKEPAFQKRSNIIIKRIIFIICFLIIFIFIFFIRALPLFGR